MAENYSQTLGHSPRRPKVYRGASKGTEKDRISLPLLNQRSHANSKDRLSQDEMLSITDVDEIGESQASFSSNKKSSNLLLSAKKSNKNLSKAQLLKDLSRSNLPAVEEQASPAAANRYKVGYKL